MALKLSRIVQMNLKKLTVHVLGFYLDLSCNLSVSYFAYVAIFITYALESYFFYVMYHYWQFVEASQEKACSSPKVIYTIIVLLIVIHYIYTSGHQWFVQSYLPCEKWLEVSKYIFDKLSMVRISGQLANAFVRSYLTC